MAQEQSVRREALNNVSSIEIFIVSLRFQTMYLKSDVKLHVNS